MIAAALIVAMLIAYVRSAFGWVAVFAAAFVIVSLSGCAGIPDYEPPPPRTEPREVWRRDDNGPWYCTSRARTWREICGNLVKC